MPYLHSHRKRHRHFKRNYPQSCLREWLYYYSSIAFIVPRRSPYLLIYPVWTSSHLTRNGANMALTVSFTIGLPSLVTFTILQVAKDTFPVGLSHFLRTRLQQIYPDCYAKSETDFSVPVKKPFLHCTSLNVEGPATPRSGLSGVCISDMVLAEQQTIPGLPPRVSGRASKRVSALHHQMHIVVFRVMGPGGAASIDPSQLFCTNGQVAGETMHLQVP